MDEALKIDARRDGVIAWVKAAPTCANTFPQKSCFGWGSYLSENCKNKQTFKGQQEHKPLARRLKCAAVLIAQCKSR